MRISNEDLLTSGPVSLTTSTTLRPIYLGHIAQYAIQLVFTGTPGGNFTLECSNDPGHPNAQSKVEQSEDVDNWTTVADSAQAIAAAGNHVWNAENVGYLWVRVVWTQTSGTGSLISARVMAKGV